MATTNAIQGLADTETRRTLILQAAKEFPHPNLPGSVAWTRAFEVHPDWKSLLGATNEKGLGRHYAFASNVLRKTGARQDHRATAMHVQPPAVPGQPAPAVAPAAEEPVGARQALTLALPWTRSALASVMKWSPSNAGKALERWMTKGWVKRIASGKYEPTQTFPVTATAMTAAPTQVAAAMTPGGRLDKPQRAGLYKELQQQFPDPKKGINWKAAIEGRPEIKALLNIVPGNYYYSSESKQVLGVGKRMRRAASHQAPMTEESAQTINILAGSSFCPHCGNDLRMVNQAMQVQQQIAAGLIKPPTARNGRH